MVAGQTEKGKELINATLPYVTLRITIIDVDFVLELATLDTLKLRVLQTLVATLISLPPVWNFFRLCSLVVCQ